jgi:hypothetical protein
MILLADLIERYSSDLLNSRGDQLLPSHHQALRAMRRCRNQYSKVMLLQCQDCQQQLALPHSCGHRSCPHCQQHESQQWLERQRAKLLQVSYFMVTFTIPAQLRGLFWAHQRLAYDLLLKAGWQTIDRFSRRDRFLNGRSGAHAVLHTHTRSLSYHPHVHFIVPAAALNPATREWKQRGRRAKFLFPVRSLARVFRAKMFAGMQAVGLSCSETLPQEWVVHCKKVGRGWQALTYLGRYLYRGVLPEKNILSDKDGIVSFAYRDNKGKRQVRQLPGAEFLWLLLQHVLPRRFRRVRDFGLLHANAKAHIQTLQLILHMPAPPPVAIKPRQPVLCEHCRKPMAIVARLLEPSLHRLC